MNETSTTPKRHLRPKSIASSKGRSRARLFAVQAVYQLLVGQQPVTDIDAFTRDLNGFNKADALYFDALLSACSEQAQALDEAFLPFLDRPIAQISPIEHAVMRLATLELKDMIDVPWRVVINEAIELTKTFGGTDGHKYVNAVLNEVAKRLRATECQHDLALGLIRAS